MPNSGQHIEDALTPRISGTTESMTLQVLAQIRDSLTAQNRDVRSLTESMAEVRERVIRLEENNRRLEDLETDVKEIDVKVGILMRDKDNRDGASGLWSKFPVWLGFLIALGSVFSAVYLAGRSAGIIPAPPVAPAHVEATIQRDERRIEGTVGGKP